MASLQFVDVPGYSALLLRRSFRHLNQDDGLIPRSKEWLAGKGAKWNDNDKRWTFPSGARLTFGYLDSERDKDLYQGGKWNFIGFDELTQFPEGLYRYLFSRLRKPAGFIPSRMRAGSNPGGIGHEWVKKRFVAPGAPKYFVRAIRHDNPHVDQADYEKSLAELLPFEREQLDKGDWDILVGGRFKAEWFRYYRREAPQSEWLVFGDKRIHRDNIKRRFVTVDPAASVKETAKKDPDYTVVSSWGQSENGYLVWLGCKRKRVEIPDIAPLIAQEYQRFGAGKVIIESGGTQKGIPQLARRKSLANGNMMNVVEFQPGGRDKLDRATHFLNMAEAGRVWFPQDDPFFPLDEVEAELLRFTGDEKQQGHDDIVDSASIAAEEVTKGTVQVYNFVGQGKFGVVRAGIDLSL